MTRPLSIREALAAALEPEIWVDDLPVSTRAEMTHFQARRLASVARADALLAAIANASIDHTALAQVADAASKGPWKVCGTIYEHMNCEIRGGEKGEGLGIAQLWDGPNAFNDGRHIAAASPATVLALIAQIDALRNRSAQADRELAEAVGLLKRTDPFTSTLANGAAEIRNDIGAFLSRMAERELPVSNHLEQKL